MELCDLESISEMCGIQVSGERGGRNMHLHRLFSFPISQECFVTTSPVTSNKSTEKGICIYQGCI